MRFFLIPSVQTFHLESVSVVTVYFDFEFRSNRVKRINTEITCYYVLSRDKAQCSAVTNQGFPRINIFLTR